MKLQDVSLKAMAKKISWLEAAEIAGVHGRSRRPLPIRRVFSSLQSAAPSLASLTSRLGRGLHPALVAIAFLVGYAVDVFFAFLEGVLQTFTRRSGSAPPASLGGKT